MVSFCGFLLSIFSDQFSQYGGRASFIQTIWGLWRWVMKCFFKTRKGFSRKKFLFGLYSNCVSKTVDVLSAEDQGQPQAEDTEVMNVAFQEDVPSDSQTEEKLPCPNGDQPLAFSGALNFLPLFLALSTFVSDFISQCWKFSAKWDYESSMVFF